MSRVSQKRGGRIAFVLVMLAAATLGYADELLSGPYSFDSVTAVHVKPGMLADGWGMTLGASWETVINQTVTAGAEVDWDVPVVPYPAKPTQTIERWAGGLRLGVLVDSTATFHTFVNNTIGVGATADQTFVYDEVLGGGEVNVTRGIRVFAGVGYRYTYGINGYQGLSDEGARGLIFDVGLRYGDIGR